MRPLALLTLLLLLAPSLPAQAQNAVHRCLDARGNPLFSDQPCSALQATPVTATPAASGTPPPGAPVPLRRCAATPDELRQRVIAAFAARDPNQLAGLMLWQGYGRGAAVADVRALAALVKEPLLQLQLASPAPAASGSLPAPPAIDADSLQLQAGGGQSARFAIAREAGCLWLRYAD